MKIACVLTDLSPRTYVNSISHPDCRALVDGVVRLMDAGSSARRSGAGMDFLPEVTCARP